MNKVINNKNINDQKHFKSNSELANKHGEHLYVDNNRYVEPSSSIGLQNNGDGYSLKNNFDNYKPSMNFPDSARNLNNIRSGYLQKRQDLYLNTGEEENTDNLGIYPVTANNEGRLISNRENVTGNRADIGNRKTMGNRDIMGNAKRQQSLNNLNKVNSEFIPRNTQQYQHKQQHSWNSIWFQTINPNKKIEIH